jgi:hypothetical protein
VGYEKDMWQTTTPDGRTLILRRTEEGWLATCLATRAEGATAEEAIRGAVGSDLNGNDAELERWIADHVAELDAAAD